MHSLDKISTSISEYKFLIHRNHPRIIQGCSRIDAQCPLQANKWSGFSDETAIFKDHNRRVKTHILQLFTCNDDFSIWLKCVKPIYTWKAGSAERVPARARLMNNRFDVIFYCPVSERSRAFSLQDSPLITLCIAIPRVISLIQISDEKNCLIGTWS